MIETKHILEQAGCQSFQPQDFQAVSCRWVSGICTKDPGKTSIKPSITVISSFWLSSLTANVYLLTPDKLLLHTAQFMVHQVKPTTCIKLYCVHMAKVFWNDLKTRHYQGMTHSLPHGCYWEQGHKLVWGGHWWENQSYIGVTAWFAAFSVISFQKIMVLHFKNRCLNNLYNHL